jgi:hypothetical protein
MSEIKLAWVAAFSNHSSMTDATVSVAHRRSTRAGETQIAQPTAKAYHLWSTAGRHELFLSNSEDIYWVALL